MTTDEMSMMHYVQLGLQFISHYSIVASKWNSPLLLCIINCPRGQIPGGKHPEPTCPLYHGEHIVSLKYINIMAEDTYSRIKVLLLQSMYIQK